MSFSLTTSNQSSPLGPMPDGWRLVHLKDITTKIGSGATPRGGSKVYLDTRKNYALVRSQHVFDRYFDRQGMVFISDEHAAELSKVALQPRDILLNITGDGITFGRSCIVPDDVLPACVNQHVSIIRTRPDVCLPEYLLSYLTHPAIKGYIESFNAGGSRRAITKGHIESFEVPLPPLEEQKEIAHILGTLDDKIELNQQMNQTLEGIARALFKSWFIDFDPVRAKLDGRQPAGMDAETAALFPDSFEDSPLGKIPKGWEVGSLLEQAELISGGTPKTSNPEYWNGNIQWASAKDVSQCTDAFLIRTERKITSLGLEESSTKIIDAFSSVIVARGATTGRLAMFGSDIAMNQTCYALRSLLSCPFGLYCHLRFIIEDLVRTAHGSVFDTITTSTFKSSRVILPSKQVLMQFEEKIKPLFKRILIDLEEVESIVHIRDSLLPKLLSGEICIKDAEQALEAVA